MRSVDVAEVEFAVALVAIILAVVAMALSVKFFSMSEESARNIRETTADIENTVLRLEAIIDRLYRDTFGLVKEAMGDLRARAGADRDVPGQRVRRGIDERTAARIDEVREQMDARLATELDRSQASSELRRELEDVVETAIERTRDAQDQARHEAVEAELAKMYQAALSTGRKLTAGEVTTALVPVFGVREVADSLLGLRRRGSLQWTGDLTPESDVMMRQ